MILRFAAMASRTKPSARSGLPTVSSACITASLAPPWSGPFKVAMAAVIAPCMSARVDAATRAAKVEALNSWSACRTKATSMARPAVGNGRGDGPGPGQLGAEAQELEPGREATLVEEEDHLLEARLLGQGVDVDPRVGEHAALPVDRGDAALAGHHLPETARPPGRRSHALASPMPE